jgi:polysaccharide deacetylase family protein (PEP-CTERM system associated)
MVNAFSVDLEDWFCVHNLAKIFPIDLWPEQELRVEPNTRRILALLEKHNVRATFFVLGWIAEKCPRLILDLAAAGHEVATHGYAHIIVKHSGPNAFEQDLKKSLDVLESLVRRKVVGFRAPSFSVDYDKPWIFEILAKYGIKYDSSVYPVSLHPDYANPGTPLGVHETIGGITEFPMSCFTVGKAVMPCSGGGYFRLLPYAYTAFGIKRCNRQGRPAVFYIHPWEIDPGQPRVKGMPLSKRLRHYVNLDKTHAKLSRLLERFDFTTVANVLGIGSTQKSSPFL